MRGHAVGVIAAVAVIAARGSALGPRAASGAPAGALDFSPPQEYDLGTPEQEASDGAVAIADVTGDGRPDVLVTTNAMWLYVVAQKVDRSLAAPVSYALPGVPDGPPPFNEPEIATGDFNRDRRTDVAVGTPAGVAVFYQRADHTLAPLQIVPGTSRTFEVLAHDMNRDGVPDLVVSSDYGLKLAIATRAGFSTRLVAPDTYLKVNVADTNRDGRQDIVACCVKGDELTNVLTQKPDGSFARQRYRSFAMDDMLVADLAGDGRSELVNTQGWGGLLTVAQVSATGPQFPTGYGVQGGAGRLAAGDLNRDGRRDIVVGHSGDPTVGVLLQNRDHSFQRERLFWATPGGAARDIAVGEVDRGGRPDIAMVDNGGELWILRQNGGGALAAVGAEATITSGPSGVVPASATTATFSFRSTGAHPRFLCSLDGETISGLNCPSDHVTYAHLAPGLHTFWVSSTDGDLGPSQFSAERIWSIGDPGMLQPVPPLSPKAPDTTITSGPPATTDSPEASFTYVADEPGADFECELDADPAANWAWQPCDEPVGYLAIFPGKHLYAVRAVDATGHADPTPAVYTWTVVGPRPQNDDFANAEPLPSDTDAVGYSNEGATKEPGEPDHAGSPGGHSLWWTWTAPLSATYVISADGGLDTLLAVYTGSALGALTPVASNDDVSASDRSSRVTIAATAGTTYDIATDTKGDSAGPCALRFARAG